MTIRHLKIFVAVCEYGSTTKAAEQLYIAQPTISTSISELEKYYNVNLFDRINQRLVLTEIGQELLAKAKEILLGFEDFESLAAFRGQSPRVHIGATLTLGQTLITEFLKKIQNEYPQIETNVLIRPYSNIETDIENGNIDFAVVEGEVMSPMMKNTPLKQDKLVVVSMADFDVPNKLTVEELAKYPLLLRERGNASRDNLEREFHARGLHINPKMDSVNNQALITAIYASLGISILPESFVKGHIERGKFKRIDVEGLDINYRNYMVIHKNKKLNNIQQQAYELLLNI